MAEERRRNLGRGLSALFGEDDAAEGANPPASAGEGPLKSLPIEFLKPGRYQPRHIMETEQIEDLAQSIRQMGILQPILVRPHPAETGVFEIIAGERRWRAAQQASLHEVPVIIKDLSDKEALEVALVENLQRQDLSPIEEASGYRRLMDEFGHTQEVLAKALGKSRSHVANILRLLGLPDAVRTMVDSGALSAGHARALIGAADPLAIAKTVVKRRLSVRQTERLVKGGKQAKGSKPPPTIAKDTDTLALERELGAILGLKVDIKFKNGKGDLTVHYQSLEQLDDVIERLSRARRSSAENL
jgi:ParB family chromosome partitioning protein